MLPIIALLRDNGEHLSQEENNFNRLKTEILWYSGSAGATDTIPGLGLITVPAIQGKMLHSLANQYGITWDKQSLAEFIGTLGTGFGLLYLSKLGVRQLIKFIPVYGQTVGAVTAAAVSFASTFAIGRVACKYLYHKQRGESVSGRRCRLCIKVPSTALKESPQMKRLVNGLAAVNRLAPGFGSLLFSYAFLPVAVLSGFGLYLIVRYDYLLSFLIVLAISLLLFITTVTLYRYGKSKKRQQPPKTSPTHWSKPRPTGQKAMNRSGKY